MANTIFAPLPSSPGFRRWCSSFLLHAAVVGVLLLPLSRPVRYVVQTAVLDHVLVPMPPPPAVAPVIRSLAESAPSPATSPEILDTAPEPAVMPATLVPIAATMVPDSLWGNVGPVGAPPGGVPGANAGPSGMVGGAETPEGGMAGCPRTDPLAIIETDPEYSELARAAKLSGVVVVNLIIGADGRVQSPSIGHGLGLGLDEKALAAVKQWRFRPATACGRAVAIAAQVEVRFQLY